MFEIRCLSIHGRLQTTLGPADVAADALRADALRVCPMACGFGFVHHVMMITIII